MKSYQKELQQRVKYQHKPSFSSTTNFHQIPQFKSQGWLHGYAYAHNISMSIYPNWQRPSVELWAPIT